MQRLKEHPLVFHEVNDIALWDGLSVDTDAFAEVHQMGRGIETYLVSAMLKDGCDGMRTGTLSVGTRNVDTTEIFVRMPEVLIERMGILQAFLVAADALFLKHRHLREQIVTGLLVVHYQLK